MKPIQHFESVWERAEELVVIHSYLVANVSGAMPTDELLRAEWAMRVSALDLFMHELAAQRMLEVFEGNRAASTAFQRFRISLDTHTRVTANPLGAAAAFDLEVREQLGIQTFQDPDKIAEAVRLCCDLELWNEVALHLGATQATKQVAAKNLKRSISAVVQRRNKIVHEGDLQPGSPRTPWTVSRVDLLDVKTLIERVVRAIDALVA